MVKISFSPIRSDEELMLDVEGRTVYVNGEAFDFSPLNDGDRLPAGAVDSFWFQGDVTLVGEELRVTIRLPHGPDAPESRRYPSPVTVGDGPVDLPPNSGQPVPAIDFTPEAVDEN